MDDSIADCEVEGSARERAERGDKHSAARVRPIMTVTVEGAAYLSPTKPLSPSKSQARLEPIHAPYSPGWKAERAKTPPSFRPKPEIISDSLTYLDKRSKRQSVMHSVTKFKADASKVLAELQETGTPKKHCLEALRRTQLQGATYGGVNRSLDFGTPLAGRLRPNYNKSSTTIFAALEFFKRRAQAIEDGKINTVKDKVQEVAREAASASGVPDYLLDEAVAEMLDAMENPPADDAAADA